MQLPCSPSSPLHLPQRRHATRPRPTLHLIPLPCHYPLRSSASAKTTRPSASAVTAASVWSATAARRARPQTAPPATAMPRWVAKGQESVWMGLALTGQGKGRGGMAAAAATPAAAAEGRKTATFCADLHRPLFNRHPPTCTNHGSSVAVKTLPMKLSSVPVPLCRSAPHALPTTPSAWGWTRPRAAAHRAPTPTAAPASRPASAPTARWAQMSVGGLLAESAAHSAAC